MPPKHVALFLLVLIVPIEVIASVEHSEDGISLRDYALFLSAIVAVILFFISHIGIPLFKYFFERRKKRITALTMLDISCDKTLEFLGITESGETKFQRSIKEQIEKIKSDANNSYRAYISISNENSLVQELIEGDGTICLLNEEIIRAYTTYIEDYKYAVDLSDIIMRKDFLDIVAIDKDRYINAVKAFHAQLAIWETSTKALSGLVKAKRGKKKGEEAAHVST